MKKKEYKIPMVLVSACLLLLTSCLKDPAHYVDFGKSGTFVDFPLGGYINFGTDAITEAPDDKGDVIRKFAVNVASVNIPNTPTTMTFAVADPKDVATINQLQSLVTYELMPTNAYTIATTSITIPAGQQYAVTSITFHKGLLDPSKSYVLPVKIASATGGAKISANLSVHYFHFIGNDFAGAVERFYTRWNTPDSTTAPSTPRTDLGPDSFQPMTATEFTVATNYYTGPRYDISFTKTGTGSSARYSNWTIRFLPADVAAGTQWAGNITVVTPPQFVPRAFKFDPGGQYTYAQSLQLFRFYFNTASRAIIDDFTK
ncbi:MAG: DUF1735 domain-containing protein [Mucilaginibacter sp.]